MQRIRLVALTSAIATLVVFALGAGNVVHAVNNAVERILVTNTAANPVPVTGAVAVNNLPATQPVSGTVNVGNLPAIQAVSVGNTAGAPVLTRDVDGAARQPFQTTSISFMVAGDQTASDAFTVPAGKRFVVELVSAQANIQPGQRALITMHLGDGLMPIPLSEQGTYNAGTLEAFAGNQQTHISLAPGTVLNYAYNRSTSEGNAGFFVTLWGYLVDVP